ncbi:MAG: RNA polymerase sigma factor [Chitinophagaceae bacterium]
MKDVKSVTNREQELITLLKKKDVQTYNYLYDTYAGALYGVVLQIINDCETASGVLQKTFVFIFQKIDSYEKTNERLFTMMLKFARNMALEELRHKVCPIGENCKNKDHYNTSFLKGNIEKNDLWKGIKSLNQEQKRLINLAYFKGYSADEISEIEKLPVQVVKMMIRNALSELSFRVPKPSDFKIQSKS